jgi:integrase
MTLRYMRYLATGLVTLLLSISAFSVELFRYRGAAKDGGTLEYVFQAGEQNSPDAVMDPLVRTDAADMLKRRLKQAGLPAHYSPHSFRATGITNFLKNDGTLEAAQRIAGHADSRTTKLYDRRGQKVLLEDMERIRY